MSKTKHTGRHPDKLWKAVKSAWPNAQNNRPLAVGVGAVLKPFLFALGFSKGEVRSAFGFWFRHHRYLSAQLAGAARFDLEGAHAGEVSEAEAAYALAMLTQRHNAKSGRRGRTCDQTAQQRRVEPSSVDQGQKPTKTPLKEACGSVRPPLRPERTPPRKFVVVRLPKRAVAPERATAQQHAQLHGRTRD